MIVEQNNYTNLNLHIISQQLDKMEILVENQPKRSQNLSTEEYKPETSKPVFTLFEVPKKYHQEQQNQFLKEILDRIDALESQNSGLIIPETPTQQSSTIRTIETQIYSEELDNQQINKMIWSEPQKSYYPKITAPDLNIEEKPTFQNKYNANTIYEWNIDGMFEYNILNTLKQMTMVSNVCKT